MDKIKAIVKSMRPKHWVKNIFVFPALLFAAELTNMESVLKSLAAFGLFSLAASSVYLLNDVVDYESDRKHPVKKYRAIASGQISKSFAILLSSLLSISSLILAFELNMKLAIVVFVYLVNNLLYSFKLKHTAIIDILMIAFGFVLRAVGGAYAIEVPISSWFLVIIFLLTLFMAIMKRRQEFVVISKNGGQKRKVLKHYSIKMLDQMANIVLPAVLVSYVFYTLNTFYTENFIFTIPLVVYGIFRYLYLVHKKDLGESPTEVLLKDVPMAATVIIWGVMSAFLIYYYK